MWRPPPRALSERAPAAVRTIEGATLTPYGQGRIPVVRRKPDMFVTGAVYDRRGRLVRASQRTGGWLGDHALSFDMPELPSPLADPVEVSGTLTYGGTWFNHFGHFLLETVTTLWPQEHGQKIIAHPFWFGRERLPYQLEALRLLGVPAKVALVGRAPVRVERLIVPDRTFIPNAYILPEALLAWDRMREAALRAQSGSGTSTPELVFFSRTSFSTRELAARGTNPPTGARAARPLPNDQQTDELAASLGFTVIDPETLSLTEQIAVAGRARLIAGPSGSALHLSAFADEGTAVVELADGRDKDRPVLTQELICEIRGQRMGWIPLRRAGEGRDLADLRERLATFVADS